MKLYFDIFTNLLTGAGTSCLVHNRWNNRYAVLLEALLPYSHDAPGMFFRKLTQWINKNRIDLAPDTEAELKLLSTDSSPMPSRYLTAFKSFPATNPAIRFYTLLITFCLDGYEHLLNKTEYNSQNKRIVLSEHSRVLIYLRRLFCMELSIPKMFTNGNIIAYFVKAAICILYSHLKKKFPDGKFEVYPLTNPRKALQDELGQSPLMPDIVEGIMKYYEALADDRPEAEKKTAPEPMSNGLPQDTNPSEASEIAAMLPELRLLKKEVSNISESIAVINAKDDKEKTLRNHGKGKLIGNSEAMKYLGLSKATLSRKRKNKEIPFIQIGMKVLYQLEDILAYREQHRIKSKNNSKPRSENKYQL